VVRAVRGVRTAHRGRSHDRLSCRVQPDRNQSAATLGLVSHAGLRISRVAGRADFGCAVLFCLTPVAARGMRGLRSLAWAFAVIMLLNGLGHTLFTILGHTVAAVTFPRPAPGFYSSPFLLLGSLWLMVRLRRTARVDFQLPSVY